MKIVIAVSLMLLAVAALVVIRALMLKPTAAKTAQIDLKDTARAREYGEKLARMIQKETVSNRLDPERQKF